MKIDAWKLVTGDIKVLGKTGTLFADGEQFGDEGRPLEEIKAWMKESGFWPGEEWGGKKHYVVYEVEIDTILSS